MRTIYEMKIGYSKPTIEILDPYVKYIHYHTSKITSDRSLILFPNVGAAITFYFNTALYEMHLQKLVSEEQPGNHNAVLHINRTDPVEIVERGMQERITVVFKPFGVNHFFRQTLEDLTRGQNPSAIDIVSSDHRYSQFVSQLAKTPADKRVGCIEDFLTSVFTPVTEPTLTNIMELFTANEKLTSIATKAATTTKTMDRLFKKHIGIRPVEFKSILKFRSSLGLKISGNQQSLTDLALESNYSDLPYMMKVYKKFTGQTTGVFFDRLVITADGKYLYQVY